MTAAIFTLSFRHKPTAPHIIVAIISVHTIPKYDRVPVTTGAGTMSRGDASAIPLACDACVRGLEPGLQSGSTGKSSPRSPAS